MPEPIVFNTDEGAMEVEYTENGKPEISPAPVAPVAAPEAAPIPKPSEPAAAATETPAATLSGTDGESASAAAPVPANSQSLYKYGDRELTGDQFYEEVMGNLLPEYTRKAQELARLGGAGTKGPDITINSPQEVPTDEVPYWENPDWKPESAADLVKATTDMIQYGAERGQRAQAAREAVIENEAKIILEAIKKVDPNLNEDLLFAHANKYHFDDLTAAYINMKDTIRIADEQRQEGARTAAAKQADPIAGRSGFSADDDGYDPGAIDTNESAVDVLRRNKQR